MRSPRAHVGALLDEGAHPPLEPFAGGVEERVTAQLRLHLQVGALLEQVLDDLGVVRADLPRGGDLGPRRAGALQELGEGGAAGVVGDGCAAAGPGGRPFGPGCRWQER